jgi:hypothetical protein
MKLQEALDIIKKKEEKQKGYMVHFETRKGGCLHSNHFPEKRAGEKLIETEQEAWNLAERFSRATGDEVVNIYVTDETYSPVEGYSNKTLKPY